MNHPNAKLIAPGERFGKWTVIESFVGMYLSFRQSCCRVRCDCGTEKVVQASRLRLGRTTSCRCCRPSAVQTHGMTDTREFKAWAAMKMRCGNRSHRAFVHYGGRGITVCEAWRDSFAVFLKDMGPCPPSMTIDRIDNDGDYEPGNCRWATRKEQANNRRSNKPITVGKRTQGIRDWAAEVGEHPETLRSRILAGWSHTRAIFEPVESKNRRPKHRNTPIGA